MAFPLGALIRRVVIDRTSISRSHFHLELSLLQALSGVVLDIGSGDNSSYSKFLRGAPGTRWLRLDVNAEKRPDIVANAEVTLPLRDESLDAVLMFNLLEHVFDHRRLIREVARVLRRGGLLCLVVPFLVGVHTWQATDSLVDDFFRYSSSGLRRLLEEQGRFEVMRITPHGGLFMTVANLLQPALRPWPVVVLATLIAHLFDRLVDRRFPLARERWVMEYFVVARRA